MKILPKTKQKTHFLNKSNTQICRENDQSQENKIYDLILNTM